MDNETRRFLSEDRYLTCDRCGNHIKVSLKDVGKFITCSKCGRKTLISKEITFENGLEDLKAAVDEYLNEK